VNGPSGFWKYGVAIVVIPFVVRVACHRPPTPLQRVWTSAALGLHALGATYGFYALWWYDHLTHAVSAGLVVAGVYAVAIPVARVAPRRVSTRTLHVVAFLALVAAGVAWEVYELHVSHLVVYGVEDTVKDLVFDVVGWAVVAPVHRRLLAHVPKGLTARAVVYARHTRPLPA
jgi:hypothetical protein